MRRHSKNRSVTQRPVLAVVSGLLLSLVLAAQEPPESNVDEWVDQARTLARDGSTAEALTLYRQALSIAPDNMDIRRDYAVTLGWADRYVEARKEFQRVLELEPEQPVWALREMARTELFGGYTADALRILEKLIAGGDESEATRSRQALALRWLSRSGEAERVYSDLLNANPQSNGARVGLAYSLADQDRLESALKIVDQGLATQPDNWEFLKTRGQVLNWMGRHLEALKALNSIPAEHSGDREVLEGRVSAYRWGGNPSGARQSALLLKNAFPANSSSERLNRDLSLEYGYSLSSSGRYIEDSDGVIDRTYGQEFSLHASPAHRFQFGFQDRRFSTDHVLEWRRYEAGWSGSLSRRLSAYGAFSDVEYRRGLAGRRYVGDGALSLAVSDRVRISAGGGRIAMDAFRAVEDQVTVNFHYGSLSWHPSRKISLETQYARYNFSDGVQRDRMDLSGFGRILSRRRLKIDVGGSSNWMWHDRDTPHFFSPSFFQTHLARVRAEGRLSRVVEYRVEFGSGIQREPATPTESPLVMSGSLVLRLNANMSLQAEGGRSTSSLERINPGRPSYSRNFAAMNLNIRFD